MVRLDSRGKQAGLGLLESILSMVIIAVATMMAMLYFGSSKRNTLTTKAVNEIQDIVGIVGGLPNVAGLSDGAAGGALDKAVVLSGQLPSEYAYSVGSGSDAKYYIGTPWTSSPPPGGGYFTTNVYGNVLTINSGGKVALPDWACQSLFDKFQLETKGADSHAPTPSGCDPGTHVLTLNFYMNPVDNL